MRTTKRWTASEAKQALAAWQRSGETMAAFARRKGVSTQRLLWWRKRLAEHAVPAELVPVVVRATVPGTGVRIALDGCEVEVGELTAATATWVALLVRALREGR